LNLRTVLILDTETTGLSPEDSQVIEIGAILFEVEKYRSAIAQVSFLVPCLANPAEGINKIPQGLTQKAQSIEDQGRDLFLAMAERCDAYVAHNAVFDRKWFNFYTPGAAIGSLGGWACAAIPEKPWICSMEDIPWPKELGIKSRPGLKDIALAHGVPVWAAHRALTDCIYLAQVFERRDDLGELLQRAMEPRRLYKALVSYDDRALAKDAGFQWNEPVPRAWTRRLTDSEAAALTFPVRPVEGG
jgi:DNA polymerase-3 subunit epsilon